LDLINSETGDSFQQCKESIQYRNTVWN